MEDSLNICYNNNIKFINSIDPEKLRKCCGKLIDTMKLDSTSDTSYCARRVKRIVAILSIVLMALYKMKRIGDHHCYEDVPLKSYAKTFLPISSQQKPPTKLCKQLKEKMWKNIHDNLAKFDNIYGESQPQVAKCPNVPERRVTQSELNQTDIICPPNSNSVCRHASTCMVFLCKANVFAGDDMLVGTSELKHKKEFKPIVCTKDNRDNKICDLSESKLKKCRNVCARFFYKEHRIPPKYKVGSVDPKDERMIPVEKELICDNDKHSTDDSVKKCSRMTCKFLSDKIKDLKGKKYSKQNVNDDDVELIKMDSNLETININDISVENHSESKIDDDEDLGSENLKEATKGPTEESKEKVISDGK